MTTQLVLTRKPRQPKPEPATCPLCRVHFPSVAAFDAHRPCGGGK